jgi:hypothetical protein
MSGLDKEWLPLLTSVPGAFTGALLAGCFGLFLLWRQNRAAKRAAKGKEQAEAYIEFLARTFSFTRRVQALGQVRQLRTGFIEQREVLFGRRKPLDLLELHDWLEVDFRPLSDAWTRVHVVGSQEAVIAADELMLTSRDLMDAASAVDGSRSLLRRSFLGDRQSAQQIQEYDALLKKFFEAREQFAVLARNELGKEVVQLPLERVRLESLPKPRRWWQLRRRESPSVAIEGTRDRPSES